MNRDNPVEAFVHDGMTRYPAAFGTVQFFWKHVQTMARDVVEADDSVFNLRESGRSFSKFQDANEYGTWIGTTAVGSFASTKFGEVKVEMGVWWKPPKLEVPTPGVIVYSAFNERPADWLKFSHKAKDPRARSFEFRGRTHVYVVPEAEPDLRGDFAVVLRELRAQVFK